MATIVVMGKQPDKKSSDRHKPSRMVRVRKRLADVLEKLAEREASSLGEEANNAIREYLKDKGLWPPPGEND